MKNRRIRARLGRSHLPFKTYNGPLPELVRLTDFGRLCFHEASRPDMRTLRLWFDRGVIEGARVIGGVRFVDLQVFAASTGDPLVDRVLRDARQGGAQ